MADFNPQVAPANDPNYLRYSKAIEPSPVIADTSKGTAMRAIAGAASSALDVADNFMKNQATNAARTGAEAIQDIYTQALKTAPENVGNVIPSPVQTGSGVKVGGSSLFDSNASMDVPDGIAGGVDRVNALTAARNGGKINDTYYTAQLTSLAKNLRSQYPGYRDYIDQEIAHVTGMNPAKEYINNLMQDINAARAGKDKVADNVLSELMTMNSQGVSGADDAVQHFIKTGDTAGALRWKNQ